MSNFHSFEQEVFTDDGEFILKVVANTDLQGVVFYSKSGTVIDEQRQANYNYFINRARDWHTNLDASNPSSNRWEALSEGGQLLYGVTADLGPKAVTVNASGVWLNGMHNSRLWHQLRIAQGFLAFPGPNKLPEITQVMVPFAEFESIQCQ